MKRITITICDLLEGYSAKNQDHEFLCLYLKESLGEDSAIMVPCSQAVFDLFTKYFITTYDYSSWNTVIGWFAHGVADVDLVKPIDGAEFEWDGESLHGGRIAMLSHILDKNPDEVLSFECYTK